MPLDHHLPEPSLPVRLAPRKMSASALSLLAQQGPLSTGRPVPDEDGIQALLSKVREHEAWSRSSASGDENAGFPFPMEAWEDILAQPDERVILEALHAKGAFSTSVGSTVAGAFLLEATGLAADGQTLLGPYVSAHRAEVARIWRLLVDRATSGATAEDLEFTPLLNLVWNRVEWLARQMKALRMSPLTDPSLLGVPRAPLLRSRQVLASSTSPDLLSRALKFSSQGWKTMVFSSSAALVAPADLPSRLASLHHDMVLPLLDNPALTTEAIGLIREWVLFHLAASDQALPSQVRVAANGLHARGHSFTPEEMKRVVNGFLYTSSKSYASNVASIIPFATNAQVREKLFADPSADILITLAITVGGEDWLRATSYLADPANAAGLPAQTANRQALLSLLAETTPAQLEGLSSGAMIGLLSSTDDTVRKEAYRLVSMVPAGLAPELAPLVKKRSRWR